MRYKSLLTDPPSSLSFSPMLLSSERLYGNPSLLPLNHSGSVLPFTSTISCNEFRSGNESNDSPIALLTQCWFVERGWNDLEKISFLRVIQDSQIPQQRICFMLHRQGWFLWKHWWPSRHHAHLALTCERCLDTRLSTLFQEMRMAWISQERQMNWIETHQSGSNWTYHIVDTILLDDRATPAQPLGPITQPA